MPSDEIFDDFKKGKLHSGRSGKIVRNRKQAIAIYLHYKQKEGKLKGRKKTSRKRSGHKRTMIKS